MLKNKVITLGATAVMGFTSLGVTQFVAHADTTKSGHTTVSYQGVSKPKNWGISVPATINESKDATLTQGANTMKFKYGVGKLAIVDADGNAFEDSSKDRTFSLSGKSQYMNNEYMTMQAPQNQGFAWLYNETTPQGVAEPTTLTKKIFDGNGRVSSIQNLTFSSKATGNSSSPLVRYTSFASPIDGTSANLALDKSYSDPISWTATETTPAS